VGGAIGNIEGIEVAFTLGEVGSAIIGSEVGRTVGKFDGIEVEFMFGEFFDVETRGLVRRIEVGLIDGNRDGVLDGKSVVFV